MQPIQNQGLDLHDIFRVDQARFLSWLAWQVADALTECRLFYQKGWWGPQEWQQCRLAIASGQQSGLTLEEMGTSQEELERLRTIEDF